MKSNMDNEKVGFGKHTNLTFLELTKLEPHYVKWLLNQDFVETKYPELYHYLMKTNIGENVVKDIDHNLLQSYFLEDSNLEKLLPEGAEIQDVYFESDCNADIEVWYTLPSSWLEKIFGANIHFLLIEIKPVVGNDYPEILRQIRRQYRAFTYNSDYRMKMTSQMLVYLNYTGDLEYIKLQKFFGKIQLKRFSLAPDCETIWINKSM
jgi:hypothetical protein